MASYLKKLGILGNNSRISSYILPNNKRSNYPLVDDKIKTDALARKANIPVPDLYFTIENMSGTRDLHHKVKDLNDFVVKPARGSMGNGIMIVEGVNWNETKDKTTFMATRQNELDYSAFIYYISTILSGLYSLNGQPDKVLVQQRLTVHPVLGNISYQGIPDIRVIVFNGYPVMAMVRLPTSISGGRGNLHQGAVGCGIDLKSGELIAAVMNNSLVEKHPDFDTPVIGQKIPYWKETLILATQCSDLVSIGYLGVDIVVHPVLGPQLLEMNARPGLSIQLANKAGLIPRLKKIQSLKAVAWDTEKRVEKAMELFGKPNEI